MGKKLRSTFLQRRPTNGQRAMKRRSKSRIIRGNQSHKETPLHTHEDGFYQIQKKTKCRWGGEEIGPPGSVGGEENCAAPTENTTAARKLNIELPYYPAISLLGKFLKELNTQIRRDTCTSMSTATQLKVEATQVSHGQTNG